MIVEDDNIIALNVQNKLANHGYEVLVPVSTGEQAVEMAIDKKPDLILMDIHLSGKIDGVDAVKKILEFMDIPIIYITANNDRLIKQRAKETMPYSYMVKPYTEKELMANIEMALFNHKYESKIKKK